MGRLWHSPGYALHSWLPFGSSSLGGKEVRGKLKRFYCSGDSAGRQAVGDAECKPSPPPRLSIEGSAHRVCRMGAPVRFIRHTISGQDHQELSGSNCFCRRVQIWLHYFHTGFYFVALFAAKAVKMLYLVYDAGEHDSFATGRMPRFTDSKTTFILTLARQRCDCQSCSHGINELSQATFWPAGPGGGGYRWHR